MKACWCKFFMGALVIVFAWWHVGWANIALTVLGAIIAVISLTGACCCGKKCECESEKTEKK